MVTRKLLKISRCYVVMRPIDSGRFTVAFAPRKQLLPVLALVDESFELTHLLRKPAAIVFVFEFQRETIAADFEIRRIVGEFGIGVAVEDEPIGTLMRRRIGEERNPAMPLGTAPDFLGDLAANFSQRAVDDACNTHFSRQGCCLILAKGGHDLDRLAGAFETYGLVERENLSVRPTPRPVSPLLRQIGNRYGGIGTEDRSSYRGLLLLLQGKGLTNRVGDGPRNSVILPPVSSFEQAHLLIERIRSLPIGCLSHLGRV